MTSQPCRQDDEHAVAQLAHGDAEPAREAVGMGECALGDLGAHAGEDPSDRLAGAHAAHDGLDVIVALGAQDVGGKLRGVPFMTAAARLAVSETGAGEGTEVTLWRAWA